MLSCCVLIFALSCARLWCLGLSSANAVDVIVADVKVDDVKVKFNDGFCDGMMHNVWQIPALLLSCLAFSAVIGGERVT